MELLFQRCRLLVDELVAESRRSEPIPLEAYTIPKPTWPRRVEDVHTAVTSMAYLGLWELVVNEEAMAAVEQMETEEQVQETGLGDRKSEVESAAANLGQDQRPESDVDGQGSAGKEVYIFKVRARSAAEHAKSAANMWSALLEESNFSPMDSNGSYSLASNGTMFINT